ncbi:DUF192 domain-containing protein [Leptolyngbya sp. FACHB-261]|uniref:DUF192 domain-containing protein n=1 Tax=Leptolyngbya sp. FACHB-261 TaxID=2692806 RepID=UPI00168618A8|nr:DUF192 domain-containing protein [Leptolyngbya sp. FACHB-261]MBD2099312.1 DUF192 domain-containing protein [Leptolyngbya sp. FACHB-261]
MTDRSRRRILAGLSGFLLMGCATSAPAASPTLQAQKPAEMRQMLPISARAQIGREVIELEVAQTPEQQEIGLMNRTSLPANRGMLFPFDPPKTVSFWMKNTKIALDMVFLREGRVQKITRNVPPCTADPCPLYPSDVVIDHVLELRGGRAAELGLRVGDSVRIEFPN